MAETAIEAGVRKFELLRRLVIDSLPSENSRRAYGAALDDFFAWYEAASPGPFRKAVVQQYRSHLEEQGRSASTVNLRLAAIRKLAAEAADNDLLDPVYAAGIAKVRGAGVRGVRSGNWLTQDQARALLLAPDPGTLKGIRDRAVLALLLGCGLRRSELVRLAVDELQQREGRWVLVDLAGKGNRVRTVPVPAWVKTAIDVWTSAARLSAGRLFRAVNKAGEMHGGSISEKVPWWIVQQYAAVIGVPCLAPHDLRRTCAKLCRASGGDLEQIQLLLGHASVQTTERYLGTRQNLVRAVNDNLGIDSSC